MLFVRIVAMLSAIGPQQDTAVRDLADVSEKPVMVSHPELGYRDCYRDAGVRGVELVQFVIDTSGHVDGRSVQVAQSSDPLLDTLAVTAVRSIVFHPARASGNPVRVMASLPFNFGAGAPSVPPGDSGIFDEACVDRKPVMKSTITGSTLSASNRAGAARMVFRIHTVIDTAGYASDIAVEPVEGASAEVLQTMRQSIADARFEPGRLKGRKVAVRMVLSIPLFIIVDIIPN